MVYKNRENLLQEARLLRKEGRGYLSISKKLQVPLQTIVRWVKDIPVDPRLASQIAISERENGSGKASLKARLLVQRGEKCEECGLSEWYSRPIVLELHRRQNEEYTERNCVLLCPNCHSLTPNWRRKKTSPSIPIGRGLPA